MVRRLEHHRARQVRDLCQPPGAMGLDCGIALGGHDPLVGREQVIGIGVEVGDSADQRGPGDEVITVGEQPGEQVDVARITLDKGVGGWSS